VARSSAWFGEQTQRPGKCHSTVTGDEAYGQDPVLRGWQETHGIGYVLAVARHHRIGAGVGLQRADQLTATLPASAWQRDTLAFIRAGDYDKTVRLARVLLRDEHDCGDASRKVDRERLDRLFPAQLRVPTLGWRYSSKLRTARQSTFRAACSERN
jgi:hypothetical protein